VGYAKVTYHLALSNGFKKAYQPSVRSLDEYEAAKHWWRRSSGVMDEFKSAVPLPGLPVTQHNLEDPCLKQTHLLALPATFQGFQ
jgi:hypothetical protein